MSLSHIFDKKTVSTEVLSDLMMEQKVSKDQERYIVRAATSKDLEVESFRLMAKTSIIRAALEQACTQTLIPLTNALDRAEKDLRRVDCWRLTFEQSPIKAVI